MNRYKLIHNIYVLVQYLSYILNDMLTFRCFYIKSLFKSRRKLKIAVIFLAFIICYIFGVFTHLFETDFSEFKTPLKQNIQEALRDLKPGQHIDQIEDINNLNYKFILDAKEVCAQVQKNVHDEQLTAEPYLVILVKSKLSNFKERENIRKTWAQTDDFNLIRTVFLLGYPKLDGEFEKDDAHSKDLLKVVIENKRYNDIVQQDFVDNYYNNTLKTMMGNF